MRPVTPPLQNPLLRGQANLSPATSLSLIAGEDAEGWPVYTIVALGALVASGDRLYRLIGFTTKNQLLLKPHGLDADPAVRYIVVDSIKGLEFIREDEPARQPQVHPSALAFWGW
jgi:hypothetical protein